MRRFDSIEEAKEWALVNARGSKVKVAVGRTMYWLEVQDPTVGLRRALDRQERSCRLWRILGWGVAAGWLIVVMAIVVSCAG